MAQVILVNAVDWPYTASCLVPDNGLASLAASLVAAGHRVLVLDLGSLRTLERYVTAELSRRLAAAARGLSERRPGAADAAQAAEEEVARCMTAAYADLFQDLSDRARQGQLDLLGLKLWVGRGSTLALALVGKLLREHPQVQVVAGGPLPSLAPEYVMKAQPGLLAVCVGEGEDTIAGLAAYRDGHGRLQAIPNLLFMQGSELLATERRVPNLGRLPPPLYAPDVYPTAADAQLPLLCISESRGCPMECPFCVHGELNGHSLRMLEAESVVEHMVAAAQRHEVRAFRLSGSFTPGKLYRRISKLLLSRGESFAYSGFAHINSFGVAGLADMARSGLCALFFGIESGSEQLLSGSLQKGIHPQQIEQTIHASMNEGVFVSGSVIFPAPGETQATQSETLRFLIKLFAGSRGAVPVVSPLPEPGSRWYEQWERFGFTGEREALIEALCHRPPHPLLPVQFADPLPYALDGHRASDIALQTVGFTQLLEAGGVLTNVTDDMVLIARLAGLTPRELRDWDRRVFACVDVEGIRALLRRMREQGAERTGQFRGAERAPGS